MHTDQSHEEYKKEIELIKIFIVKIFQNEKIKDLDTLNDDFNLEKGLLFDEMDLGEKIRTITPFIHGFVNQDKDKLAMFIENCIQMNLFDTGDHESSINNKIDTFINMQIDKMKQEINQSGKNKYIFDPVKIYTCVKSGEIGRNDKIFLNNTLKEFSLRFVDWEDVEFIETLVKACFYKSLLCLKSILCEENIKMNTKRDVDFEDSPSTTVFKLMKCGHLNSFVPDRKTLLQRRIKPTKTLDEYADSVLADMKRREAEKNEFTNLKDDDIDSADQEQRKDDEFDEFRRNFRGNTKKMG